MNEGIEEQQKLVEAGFNTEEITQWQAETKAKLAGAGFSDKEQNEYFGIHDPDMTATKDVIEHNLKVQQTVAKAKGGAPTPADGFVDAFEAGFQMSVSGLIKRQALPDKVLPEDAPFMARIASQVGQLAGDVPAMVAGAYAGGQAGGTTGFMVGAAGGSIVPGAGTLAGATFGAGAGMVLGGGAGAFALPGVMRKALMDHYEKGDIQDSRDFFERSSALFLTALKEGTVGAATSLVGGKAGVMAAESGINAISKAVLPPAAELATMVTVGKGLEGQVPNARDFLDGAVILAGMHGSIEVAGKMRNVYTKTGMTPVQIGEAMNEHPTVQQELLSENIPFPKALEGKIEVESPKKEFTKREPYNPEQAVEGRMKDMIAELKKSERSQSLIRDEQGNVTNRIDENTFPEWFSKVKSGSLEKTLESLKNPESAASKRLRAEAESHLTEGYQLDRKNGGYEAPDAQFRAHKGLPPHEATPVQTGEVVHFDGSDGVIKTPDGNTIHFDASTVKENFKVGDTVHFIPDSKQTEFATTESVFGTKTPEQMAELTTPKEEAIIETKDGEIAVQTGDGGTRPPTAQEKILGQIGERGPRSKAALNLEKFYTDTVDKFNPIKNAEKELTGGKVDSAQSPYDLARMANDYKAKVKHIFEYGTIDYKTLKKTGKSFMQIIEPIRGDAQKLDGLKAFMISERALEIESRGIKSGFDLDAAREVVEKGKGEYKQMATELVDFQNKQLEYARDAGLISDKSLKAMKEAGKSYVSFSRIFEPEEIAQSGKNPGKAKPLKNLKGSDRLIQDPFLSMVQNTEAILKAAEANRSMSAMVDLINQEPNQSIVEKVPTRMKPIEVSEAEVKKAFENTEVGSAISEMLKQEGGEIDHEAFNIFRPIEHRNLAPNEFDVMVDGKRQVYKTDVELAEAFKRLGNNTGSMNLAFKMFNKLTAIKKLGITFTPDFQIKNGFRDQLTMGVFSEGGTVPFKDIFTAMGDIIKHREPYQDWLKSGGAGGAFLELNDEYIAKDILKISSETGIADKAFNLIKTPFEKLAVAGTIIEEGTRLAEYKRVTKGAAEGDVLFKGGMASREVTVDFQRIGAKMSAFNSITAFFNVAVQGLDRTARAVKADPAGVTAKGVMYLTAPSLALWYLNHDDERYKEIPRWQKDTFWHIITNDWQAAKDVKEIDGLPKHLVRQTENGGYEINRGHIYRLPKPQELGMIFATIPERMMERFFTDNPRALKDFGESVLSLATPNLIPDAILPLAEQGVNKNLFTSAPLVSPQMEERLPQLQYTEYTSSTAKAIGKIIGQIPLARDIGPESTKLNSPAVVDNYIKSWTGALGTYAIDVLDKSLEKSGIMDDPNRPTSTLADIWFIKSFVTRYPSASPQHITDFYSRSTEANKVFKSIEFLKKQGDSKGVEQILSNPDYQEIMVNTSEIRTALGQMSSAVHKIYMNKEMNKDEKRQQIDTIYYMMSETAKRGNEFMDQWSDMVKKNRLEDKIKK